MGVIERQSAGGHDTMHVRVMFELLIPGVEHAEEADLGAEMLRIASDFEEGCSTGVQQEMVQDLLVLQGERHQFTALLCLSNDDLYCIGGGTEDATHFRYVADRVQYVRARAGAPRMASSDTEMISYTSIVISRTGSTRMTDLSGRVGKDLCFNIK